MANLVSECVYRSNDFCQCRDKQVSLIQLHNPSRIFEQQKICRMVIQDLSGASEAVNESFIPMYKMGFAAKSFAPFCTKSRETFQKG